jgi:coproporphyrinogen III oxidase-like Fe-S oxidoreductase
MPHAERAPTTAAQRAAGAPVSHLYVHLPFCAHRCGYCDFVTVVGRPEAHARYADAVLAELAGWKHVLARPSLSSVFVGGGTPTYTEHDGLERLLEALPRAEEVTVEANPETVTPELATLLRRRRVTRVSVGAQSFTQRLLDVLERRASPDDVRRAVHTLRDAGFDNISLDLLYGIPGQSAADLEHDLAEALALDPEHISCYELEAKPGTRFTHAWGDELIRQAESLEDHLERVVRCLTGAGYRWYETANFCRTPPAPNLSDPALRARSRAGAKDLRAHHNLAVWRGADYLGVGIGAVSTLGVRRQRNTPSLRRYVDALSRGCDAPSEVEPIDSATRARERLMLGLRLDEPLSLDGLEHVVDRHALERLRALGLLELDDDRVRLTHRGRFLGGGIAAEAIDWGPEPEGAVPRLRSG